MEKREKHEIHNLFTSKSRFSLKNAFFSLGNPFLSLTNMSKSELMILNKFLNPESFLQFPDNA